MTTPVTISTKPKPFCFVLMPFHKDFEDIYSLGIQLSCEEAGTYCEKVNEQIFDGSIVDRIYNQISKADIIIAEMTGKNPNVFYEVGYAHALGKTVILITKTGDDIPFDLKHYTHIIYENITHLKSELTKRLKHFISHPSETNKGETVDIEIFLGNHRLSSNTSSLKYHNISSYYIDLSFGIVIQNQSNTTYNPGELKVGIIGSRNIEVRIDNHSVLGIELPDGRCISMFEDYGSNFFPQMVYRRKFGIGINTKSRQPEEVVYFRIFSRNGYRDYPLPITILY